MSGVLEFLFAPLRDRIYDSYFKKREKRKAICRAAISRIENERWNFRHIVDGRGYRSKDHKRAVEQISFETLHDSMVELQKIRRFRTLATGILAEVTNRNAAGVLIAIDRIEPKLKKFLGD